MGKIEQRRKLLGKAIKHRRKQIGYTQEEMAEKLDLSVTHYAHIEQGRQFPSMVILYGITEILGLDIVLMRRKSGNSPAKKIEIL